MPRIQASLLFVPALVLCPAVLCPAIVQAQNQLTKQEQAAGWKLLFDGSTTTGWTEVTGLPFPKTWTIQDGCLKTIVGPGAFQDIRTVETYRSFEFEFEWKLAKGGNSGVKYMVQKTDRWQKKGVDGFEARARGFEYQLLDDAVAEEAIKDHKRGTASLYTYFAPTPVLQAEPEKFHKSRIVVRGDHVEHWYDGARVLSFEITDPIVVKGFAGADGKLQRDTMISLQHHDAEVWFRNLKIRRLD